MSNSKPGFCQSCCGVLYFMLCGTAEEVKEAVVIQEPIEFDEPVVQTIPEDELASSPATQNDSVANAYQADRAQQARLSVTQPNLPVLPRASFHKNAI